MSDSRLIRFLTRPLTVPIPTAWRSEFGDGSETA